MRAAPLAVLFFAGLASPAAADCPAFYRFVDFGITDDNGTLYRGGPVFRAEDFDGTPLLFTPATVCEDVADLLKDGRGNPIPVVSRITYDRRETDPALGWITVSAVPDASAKAAAFVALHAESLTLPGTVPFRGETFLCAQTGETEQSCQVVSPFATDTFNRLFSNDNPLLRTMRDIGMGLVNAAPRLRRGFIREAAGLTGDLPRLMRG